jgi:hypothetical protein
MDQVARLANFDSNIRLTVLGDPLFRKVIKALLFCWNIALSILLGYLVWKGGYQAVSSQGIEYKDFVAILLTAVIVMVAVAALFVGAAAVWTYKEGMELIRTTADKAAREVASSVATRVAREARPAETDPAEAEAIVDAVFSDQGNSDGER